MKTRLLALSLAPALCLAACEPATSTSDVKVTSVNHSSVKRQSIGNCWLYAQASWLESMIKSTTGEDVNVSETYWTYWDMYNKLLQGQPIPEDELNTGGTWSQSNAIIRTYGWVTEEFLPAEKNKVMSSAQACAEEYVMEQGKEGGTLYNLAERTPEHIRSELDKAFSCDGRYTFDMTAAYQRRRLAKDTMLTDVKTKQEKSLSTWLGLWQQVSVSAGNAWGPYEGKKLPTTGELTQFKRIEQRIKAALNDHQPVVLSWFVTFNAADDQGLFNLGTMAQAGELGSSGGHMIVLNDYTVRNVPGRGVLGEGDMSDKDKALALTGDLDYLIVKNSWGSNRPDRPWLRDGYSRISWDYLTSRYENKDKFSTFIRGLVLPPGY